MTDCDPLILHIDMDCFFAAVEMREDPSLKNKPIAVGGKGERGVICAANYPARSFGVKSAMSGRVAEKLCPQLKFLPVRFDLYREASSKIFEIFKNYSPKVEGLSLDEAFIDISHLGKSIYEAKEIAIEIKKKIFDKTKLSASIGISYCRYLAKMASDINKPNGICIVDKKSFPLLIQPLSVAKLPGVGPVLYERLNAVGIRSIKDLEKFGETKLAQLIGNQSSDLFNCAKGIGPSEISVERSSKSISIENTFKEDLLGIDEIRDRFQDLFSSIRPRLEKQKEEAQNKAVSTLFVKIKYFDFKITTSSKTLKQEDLSNILEKGEFNPQQEEILVNLLKDGYEKYPMPVRLLGLGVKLEDKKAEQLNFF